MSRPLLPVAVSYAAGVVLAACLELPLTGLFLLASVLGLGFLVSDRFRPPLLAALFAAAGMTLLTARTVVLSPLEVRAVLGEEPRLATLRGRLTETPSIRVYQDRSGVERERSMATLAVEAVQEPEGWRAVRGEVLVSTKGVPDETFFAGRRVEVQGVLQRPARAAAPGLFDYRAHLRWKGVHRQLVVDSPVDWSVADPEGETPRRPLADRFLAWARTRLAAGMPADESVRLLWAMTLGWRTALTDEVAAPFMRTGTMHIFAISGLHIAMITGILVAVLRVLQLPRAWCGGVVIPLIWAYTAATGWQASAVRASIMMSVVVLGWSLRRPGDLLNSLSASALIILLADPRQLFQASFQLSFFVVLSLALLAPRFQSWAEAWGRTDPLLPEELMPRWRRWLTVPLSWLRLNLSVSVAAWLGSVPLVAHYFHLVTPVGLLANLVVVPMAGLALMSCLGALACGTWLPTAGGWFSHAAWFWMTGMVWVCERLSAWPGAFAWVASPGAVGLVLAYLLLLGVGSGWLLMAGRRRGIAVALALAVIGWSARGLVPGRATEITLLPARGGGAQWVDAPGWRRDLLIDGGDESDVGFLTEPFLRARGIDRLPRWVVTHGDVRHVGGWQTIMAGFAPDEIVTGGGDFRSPAYRQLTAELGRRPDRWRRVGVGDEVVGWSVFQAGEGAVLRADDGALVLEAEWGGTRVLMLSDLGGAGQEEWRARGNLGRVDLVVAGVPSDGEPLNESLLAILEPQVVILHDSLLPAGSRADDRLLRRLSREGRTVLRVSDTGAVTIRLARGRWEVRGMEGTLARGESVHGSPAGAR
ncbi:MAG: ComEC/Rec2 family competence protein [Limisphaerales bacterium]